MYLTNLNLAVQNLPQDAERMRTAWKNLDPVACREIAERLIALGTQVRERCMAEEVGRQLLEEQRDGRAHQPAHP